MEIGQAVYLCLMFLVSTLINVTVAGWLSIRLGEFLLEKLQSFKADRTKGGDLYGKG